uniref:PDZ domain-containing protein n=1 Tax=Macrostomum lignano TaxID=282301 RepID=A0A1I8FQM5_9PLAT
PMKRRSRPAVAVGSCLPPETAGAAGQRRKTKSMTTGRRRKSQLRGADPASPAIATNTLYRRRSSRHPGCLIGTNRRGGECRLFRRADDDADIPTDRSSQQRCQRAKSTPRPVRGSPLSPEASAATPESLCQRHVADELGPLRPLPSGPPPPQFQRLAGRRSRRDQVDIDAGSDAPTPKRLFASRKRTRLAAAPRAAAGRSPAGRPPHVTSAKKISSPRGSGTLAASEHRSPMAVSGRVLKLMPDGSVVGAAEKTARRQVRLLCASRQKGAPLPSVLGVGDEILEIEDMPTTAMPLDDLYRFISDKRSLLIR